MRQNKKKVQKYITFENVFCAKFSNSKNHENFYFLPAQRKGMHPVVYEKCIIYWFAEWIMFELIQVVRMEWIIKLSDKPDGHLTLSSAKRIRPISK